ITGRQDGDTGALVDQYLGFPDRGQDTKFSRPQKSLGGQDTFALPNILTTPSQVTAEAWCPVNLYLRIAPIGVLDLHPRIGTLWRRRSRHDFDRRAWGDAMPWPFASREDFEHLEHCRPVVRGARYICVAHRIAVHGGIVIQGNVALGRDLLGCDPMQRLEQ